MPHLGLRLISLSVCFKSCFNSEESTTLYSCSSLHHPHLTQNDFL